VGTGSDFTCAVLRDGGGGFADSNTIGAFYLTAAQQVTIQVFGQPSSGADGAGVLRLTLLDAGRNVIATVPERLKFSAVEGPAYLGIATFTA